MSIFNNAEVILVIFRQSLQKNLSLIVHVFRILTIDAYNDNFPVEILSFPQLSVGVFCSTFPGEFLFVSSRVDIGCISSKTFRRKSVSICLRRGSDVGDHPRTHIRSCVYIQCFDGQILMPVSLRFHARLW